MSRHKDANWNLQDNIQTWEEAQAAVLMDIRDELKQMNLILSVLRCTNFLNIPHKLDAIRRNTAKKRRTKK